MPPNSEASQKMNATIMSQPHISHGTNGQYNDEYIEEAHQKMKVDGLDVSATSFDRRLPISNPVVSWRSTPFVNNIPASCDDEFHGEGICTSVDLSMVRNASENALKALCSKEFDEQVEVTVDNCVRPLECVAQQYAWGKIGSRALVARLKDAQTKDFTIDETKPYAELWIGTHPNGMSNIILPVEEKEEDWNIERQQEIRSVPLVKYVQQNPEMHLGVKGMTTPSEDYDLTFLFKVLSIEKVLSIQAHPDKFLAAQLHTQKPNVYKDPNHKPEMAVALTDDFEAMSGFRPLSEIAKNMTEYSEFTTLVGLEIGQKILDASEGVMSESPKRTLSTLFRLYMEADEQQLQMQLKCMMERLSAKDNPSDLDSLIMKLATQFPGDSGIFAPIIFNYLKLKKGDAFYIGANEPHAYIYGEILECMACSDNVVRAGLTPKLKDVDTLVDMLTYKCTTPEVTRGEQIDPYTLLHVPPVEDFAIEIVEIPAGTRYVLSEVRSPSVILTLGGSGILQQGSVQNLSMSFGKAAFMSANTSTSIIADEYGSGLKLVRALSNVHL